MILEPHVKILRRTLVVTSERGCGISRQARQIILRLFLVCVVFSINFAAWSPAFGADFFQPRVEQDHESAVVSIKLPRKSPYTLFLLTAPDRVVLDIPSTSHIDPDVVTIAPSGLVKRVRRNKFGTNITRIVIDCTLPVRVLQATLDDSHPAAATPAGGAELVIQLIVKSVATSDVAAAEHDPHDASGAFTERVRDALGRQAPTGAPFAVPTPRAQRSVAEDVPSVFRSPIARPRIPVVVIDPGHGGEDPGATGRSGLHEKTVTLAVARAVRQHLSKLGRFKILLTRDSDVYLPLRQRVAVARAANADVFVSIHADSMRERAVRGASVYTLSETASDSEAAALAERENKADLIGGIDLSGESPEVTNILIELARRDTMNRSIVLASRMIPELNEVTPLLANPHRQAGFIVLKTADVPSILVELGFLSNPRDEKLLGTREHQLARAGAIARAIHSYLSDRMHASGL